MNRRNSDDFISYVPIQYNKDKLEKPRKIKGLSDLSLFFFHLFYHENQPKT